MRVNVVFKLVFVFRNSPYWKVNRNLGYLREAMNIFHFGTLNCATSNPFSNPIIFVAVSFESNSKFSNDEIFCTCRAHYYGLITFVLCKLLIELYLYNRSLHIFVIMNYFSITLHCDTLLSDS